ncbi:hypothetical protein EGW08_011054 [Elysia chlorotica]|uniref:Uncharacterized protein n=1 Tax=Elysia chlorotica TaxID=188477 RepID=A0A3S1C2M4_ELYCH|nr:hypothetical protein EGW08_011054 [Elysia chlorotica]
MPKQYDNTRTYRTSRHTTYTWLTPSSNGTKAFCKLCSVKMLPRLSLIKRNEETTKHKQKIPRENTLTRSIISTPRTTTSDATKAAEIELSAMTMDHSGEIIA